MKAVYHLALFAASICSVFPIRAQQPQHTDSAESFNLADANDNITDTSVGPLHSASPLGLKILRAENWSTLYSLAAAPQIVTNISALRALAVPAKKHNSLVLTEGYYAPNDGGENTFVWNADSIAADNGGTVIAVTSNGSPRGRYLALNYGSGIAYARQFGANPSQASAKNTLAIQAAHDSLPVLSSYAHTASGRAARRGELIIAPGTYGINGQLLFYNGVTVRGGGWRNTALVLDPNTFTDPASPRWVIYFEPSVGVAANNQFGAGFFGLHLDCGNAAGKNAGACGVQLVGAQGTMMDDFNISHFGVQGLVFVGQNIGTGWVNGNYNATGVGVSLPGYGGQNQVRVGSLSVEHINSGLSDSKGIPVPFVEISGTGPTIDVLQGETLSNDGSLFCRIKNARDVTIRHLDGNNFFGKSAAGNLGTIARITGDTGNVHLDSVTSTNLSSRLVDDDAHTGGDGRPANFHYQSAIDGSLRYLSYHTDSYSPYLHAGVIDAASVNVGTKPVVSEVFTFPLTLGRFRLRFLAKLSSPNYLAGTPEYLCRIQETTGKEIEFLFSLQNPVTTGGPMLANTQVLKGTGLLVTSSGLEAGSSAPQVDFSVVQTAPSSKNFCYMTVTQLGYVELGGGNSLGKYLTSAAWSAVAETQANVLDGTATGTLSTANAVNNLPITPAAVNGNTVPVGSGNVPISASPLSVAGAPAAGQVLTASGANTAIWAPPAAPGSPRAQTQTVSSTGGTVTPILLDNPTEFVNVSTLANAVTINAPTGTPADGQSMTFRLAEDNTGGYAVTWNAIYTFPLDKPATSLPAMAREKYEITFVFCAADGTWRARGIAGPY